METLASRARLSPRQLARAFAAEVGMPPGRYVDRVRLELARHRMEDTTDVFVAGQASRIGHHHRAGLPRPIAIAAGRHRLDPYGTPRSAKTPSRRV